MGLKPLLQHQLERMHTLLAIFNENAHCTFNSTLYLHNLVGASVKEQNCPFKLKKHLYRSYVLLHCLLSNSSYMLHILLLKNKLNCYKSLMQGTFEHLQEHVHVNSDT
ncbi:hypothetical protein KIL84_019697 [Mauremys mutica]|uniref:Uncharacterized protein n=1 Tax=Mauremys mutica TaxID=74926 RepID=A0A9D3XVH9_9SAUR|nr:hypothetical protein KIL84_019697 [Mauremys mutica]